MKPPAPGGQGAAAGADLAPTAPAPGPPPTSRRTQVAPRISDVVAVLAAAAALPQPDEHGCAELDLRRLGPAHLWALAELVLGPVVVQVRQAQAQAQAQALAHLLWRAAVLPPPRAWRGLLPAQSCAGRV